MVSSECPRRIVKPRASRPDSDMTPIVHAIITSNITSELMTVSKYVSGESKLQLDTGSKWYTIVLLNGSTRVFLSRKVTL